MEDRTRDPARGSTGGKEPGPVRRPIVGQAVLALVVIVVGSSVPVVDISGAVTTSIDFEEYDEGTELVDQYEPRGVVFPPLSEAEAGAFVVRCGPDSRVCRSALSGENAIVTPGTTGTTGSPDRRHPLRVRFTDPPQEVSIGIRAVEGIDGTFVARMVASNSDGEVVVQDLETFDFDTGWHRLRVDAGSNDIAEVVVTLRASDASVPENRFVADDLAFAANEPPTARLNHSPPVPNANELVTLDATRSTDPDGDVVVYAWDVDGDGEIDTNTTDPILALRYSIPGSYRPSVTVIDDDGAIDRAVTRLRINDPPTAAFDFAPATPLVGTVVRFDAAASSDSDGRITSYRWDFDGDGRYDDVTSFRATEYTFDRTGEFVVTLEITDDNGANATVSRTVSVTRRPEPVPPTAVFGFSPSEPRAGETVLFNASGSTDPDGEITDYAWDFGDGTESSGSGRPSQQHVFSEPGEYAVALTVVDDDEQTDTVERLVTVTEPEQPLEARFEYEPVGPEVGRTVVFDASSSTIPSGRTALYRWDFDGDGVVDAATTTPGVAHRFEDFGEQRTILTIELDSGEEAAVWEEIDVRVPPTARFSYDPRRVVAGDRVRFDASASFDPDGEIVAYEWDFDDDGSTDATGEVAFHVFETAGRETVSLTVTDDDGIQSGVARTVPRTPASGPIPDPLLVAVVTAVTAVAVGVAAVSGSLGGLRTAHRRTGDGDDTDQSDEERDGSLRIARLSVGETDDAGLDDEFVEIDNESDEPYELGGVRLSDGEGNTYEFPDGLVIGARETVTVFSGEGRPEGGTLYWGRETSVWNRDADRVVLEDADGRLLDDAYYGDREED